MIYLGNKILKKIVKFWSEVYTKIYMSDFVGLGYKIKYKLLKKNKLVM